MFGSFEWDILPDPAESLPEYERVYSMEYFFWMELMDLHQWMSWPGDSACIAFMPSAHKC